MASISENAKWMIFGIVLAALLILATAIGPSIDALALTDYKLEAWVLILILIAFLIVYIVKKSSIVVNVPEKAIKVYVDVEPMKLADSTTVYGPVQHLEQKEKPVVEILCGDKNTQAWAPVEVGEMSLDGERIK